MRLVARSSALLLAAAVWMAAAPEEAGAAKRGSTRKARLSSPARSRARPSGTMIARSAHGEESLRVRARGLRAGEVHSICCDDPSTSRPAVVPFAEARADASGRLSLTLDALPHGAQIGELSGAPIEIRTEEGTILLSGRLPGSRTRATPADGCTFVESVFVHETFDDAAPGSAPAGWLVSGTDVTGVVVAVDDAVKEGDSGGSVRIEDTVSADPGAPWMERVFNAQEGVFALEFTLIASDAPGRTVMRVGAGGTSGAQIPSGIGQGLGFYEDGTIGFAIGDSIRSYANGAEHRFRVEFDPSTETFDVLVDGERLVGGRALGGDSTTLDRLAFGGMPTTTGTAWLDRVTMLSLEEDCPAVADAGPDQTVECTGTTEVTLDGSASASDSEGAELTYTWTGDFAGGTASGVSPTVRFEGHGSFTVTLVVSDGAVDSAPDTVVIEIVDTAPPVLKVCDLPSKLSPACDQMVTVEPVIMALDACTGFDVELTLEIVSSEPFDDEGDIVIRTPWDFDLRATRPIYDCARRYYLRWTATDAAGNSVQLEDSIAVSGGSHGRGHDDDDCDRDCDDDEDDDHHGGKGGWWWDRD